MRTISRCSLVTCFLLISLALLTGRAASSSALGSGGRALDSEVDEVSGYKSWTRVNPEPLKLPAAIESLCRAATADNRSTAQNPHRQKFFTVYVNEVGREAMMLGAKPRFPRGSIIVKEKLLDKQGSLPELLTTMIKREPGFNPKSGDWEYLVFDGSGSKVEARGKLENCQACHLAKSETDYVFRSYLPREVQSKLR